MLDRLIDQLAPISGEAWWPSNADAEICSRALRALRLQTSTPTSQAHIACAHESEHEVLTRIPRPNMLAVKAVKAWYSW